MFTVYENPDSSVIWNTIKLSELNMMLEKCHSFQRLLCYYNFFIQNINYNTLKPLKDIFQNFLQETAKFIVIYLTKSVCPTLCIFI